MDRWGIGMVVVSGSLGGVIVLTLAQHAIAVGLIPNQGTIFPILVTPDNPSVMARMLYKVHSV